jgi:ribonuclease HI
MKPPPENYLIAHTDGGARGNPGPAGYGIVIQDAKGNKVAALSQYLGRQTNNFAEYQALIGALEYALEHGPKALKVISDSELLVRQIKGIYKVKEPTLRDLHARAKELIARLDMFCGGTIAKPTSWPTKRWTKARGAKLRVTSRRNRPSRSSMELCEGGKSNCWMGVFRRGLRSRYGLSAEI